jgi:N-acetylglucosaminyldiphosphoundecaprenol N-acetyl-beta-D-mannosaminyltransferase
MSVGIEVRPARVRTDVLGVRVDDMPIPVLLDRIEDAVRTRGRLVVVNANAHLVMLAQNRPWLRRFFAEADIAFCDGTGVQFAIALLTGRRPHRHTPPQWIDEIARRIARTGGTVFWLGGEAEVAQAAAAVFEQRTGLRSVGVQHGYFDATHGSAENEALVAAINEASPDLLLVNMGMPRQEQWLAENWARLDARVAVTAGALVDHVAGRVRRPPLWVSDAGLEWVVRLAIEPGRLWRRYLLGLPRFGALVALQKVRKTSLF